MGRFAHDFLFLPVTSPLTPPPPIFIPPNKLAHDPAREAYHNACISPLALVHHANVQWKAIHPTPQKQFGRTHHTTTPQQWALQSLSLNISHALASHLDRALAQNSHRISLLHQPTIHGTIPYFPSGRRVLVTSNPRTVPTYHSRNP